MNNIRNTAEKARFPDKKIRKKPGEINVFDELHDESGGEQCSPHLLNRTVILLNDLLNCKKSLIGRYDAAGRSGTLP